MADALIIGGGAIGLASAWTLAKHGLAVTVLERDVGSVHAASRAAAGMLSAQLESHPSEAMAALCLRGRERHATFLPELAEASGADLEYRTVGALRVAFSDEDAADLIDLVGAQRARGWEARIVSSAEARDLEPSLSACHSGAFFPGEAVVEPNRVVDALVRACIERGVTLRTGVLAAQVLHAGGRATGVLLHNGNRLAAGHVIVAGGAWSASLEGTGIEGKLRPIRGQMLELRHARAPSRLVEGPGAYLSPRTDGRMLVGSTLEDVGFERAVTVGAATQLLNAAVRLLPHLAEATLAAHWCGFRPATRDGLPLLGATSTGALAATGHHRNGIVLSAITADIVTALVTGKSSPVELTPFAPGRVLPLG